LDIDIISYRKLVEIGFEKLGLWPANNSKWNLSEAVQACFKKFKETPGEESLKILKSGSKGQNIGATEMDEIPRRKVRKNTFAKCDIWTPPPEIKRPFGVFSFSVTGLVSVRKLVPALL